MANVGVQKMATASDELVRRAWEQYGKGNLADAEREFRAAIERTARSIDAHYGLGLVLKVAKRHEESIEVFERLLKLLESEQGGGSRYALMRRLAQGHINIMRKGDWGLETEIWKRSG